MTKIEFTVTVWKRGKEVTSWLRYSQRRALGNIKTNQLVSAK
jgi:hypothetical protein